MLRQPSGNSISADIPVVADIEPVLGQLRVESAEETAVGCLSLGDCVPRGNGRGIVEGVALAKLHRTE